MPQAIHWLNDIFLPLYLDWAVQVITIEFPMTAGFPQIQFSNMRGVYDVIATLNVLVLPEILNNTAYYCSLGVPMN